MLASVCMGRIGALLLLLVAAGWLASELPQAGSATSDGLAADWRRTAQGWERLPMTGADATTDQPSLHPLAAASLELLLALGAAAACPAKAASAEEG